MGFNSGFKGLNRFSSSGLEGHKLDWSGWGQGEVAGCCCGGNELSGSIKCKEFLDWVRNCWLLRKDSCCMELVRYSVFTKPCYLILKPFQSIKQCTMFLSDTFQSDIALYPQISDVTSSAVFFSSRAITEVFPCFFLSCKANARVYLAKKRHGPHTSWIVLFYVLFVSIVLFHIWFCV